MTRPTTNIAIATATSGSSDEERDGRRGVGARRRTSVGDDVETRRPQSSSSRVSTRCIRRAGLRAERAEVAARRRRSRRGSRRRATSSPRPPCSRSARSARASPGRRARSGRRTRSGRGAPGSARGASRPSRRSRRAATPGSRVAVTDGRDLLARATPARTSSPGGRARRRARRRGRRGSRPEIARLTRRDDGSARVRRPSSATREDRRAREREPDHAADRLDGADERHREHEQLERPSAASGSGRARRAPTATAARTQNSAVVPLGLDHCHSRRMSANGASTSIRS